MLVNENFFDFALCVICYLLIALDFSYVLFIDLLAFCSTLVLCFFCLFSFLDLACGPCFCSNSHFIGIGFYPWL